MPVRKGVGSNPTAVIFHLLFRSQDTIGHDHIPSFSFPKKGKQFSRRMARLHCYFTLVLPMGRAVHSCFVNSMTSTTMSNAQLVSTMEARGCTTADSKNRQSPQQSGMKQIWFFTETIAKSYDFQKLKNFCCFSRSQKNPKKSGQTLPKS